jgi:hypothetical protein
LLHTRAPLVLRRVAAVAEKDQVALGRVGLEARAAGLVIVVVGVVIVVVVDGSALLACADLVCGLGLAGLARVLDVPVLADAAAPAVFAPILPSSVLADAAAAAVFAPSLPSSVLADGTAPAVFAHNHPSSVLADGAAPAVFALSLPSSVLADAAAPAVFALVLPSSVLADADAPAVFALALLSAVWAEFVPMPVLAHRSTAARTTAALAVVTNTGAFSPPATAVHAHAAVLRQLVDEVLLLPGLRQSRLRAQLLQLRDGLHTIIARVQDKDNTALCDRPDRPLGWQEQDRRPAQRSPRYNISIIFSPRSHSPSCSGRRASQGLLRWRGTDEGTIYRSLF